MGNTGLDKKNAFLLASQSQPSWPLRHSPQQSLQQPSLPLYSGLNQQAGYRQPQQQPYHYQHPSQGQTFGTQQSQYSTQNQGHMQGQPFPSNHDWNDQSMGGSTVFSPDPHDNGQFRASIMPRQPVTPTPQPQQQFQQGQQNPPWFGENIRNMYMASGQQGDRQGSVGAPGPSET